MSQNRLNFEISQSDEFKAQYEESLKKKKNSNKDKNNNLIPLLLNKYFEVLESGENDENDILLMERIISLFTSLLNEVYILFIVYIYIIYR